MNYRLTLVDDDTHRHLAQLHFTKWTFFVTILSLLTVLLLGAFAVVYFTPLKTLIPGYPDANSQQIAIRNAIKIDSLENAIYRWEFYSENLKRVFEGEDPVRVDSIIKSYKAPVEIEEKETEDMSKQDSLLRRVVSEADQKAPAKQDNSTTIEGRHFFIPVKGVISEPFDRALHPYLDITAPAGSVVSSVLAGTVISAQWSDEKGYTIAIQHEGDLVSIYKRNQKLLVKIGDKVKDGTPIAHIGDSDSQTSGDHLHFELWYKGEPQDPAKYINF